MKKKLLKSLRVLLVAAGLVVGASVWAATETYDFAAWYTANSGSDTYFTLSSTSYTFTAKSTVSTAYDTYSAGDVVEHDVTTYLIASYGGTIPTGQALNSRIALDRVSTSKNNYGWRFRNTYNGLYCQTRGQDSYAYRWFSLVGLKKDETVTITFTGTIRFQSTNITATVNKGDAVTSGTTYTMSEDGDLHFEANGGVVISKIEIITKSAETCTQPTIVATAANGTNRTVTITDGVGSEATAVAGTYYATSTDDGVTYSEYAAYSAPFNISQTTKIKAYTKLTNDIESDINEVSIEAGSTIQLLTPTVTRTAELGVSFASNQSSLVGSPSVTYHYTLADGTTATGTSATDTKYGMVSVYVSASGYDDSETAEFTLAPTINGDATLSFVWETPGTEKTITISTETTAIYNEKTLGQLTYDGTEYAGLYLQSDGNWLARKGYAGLYNYTGNGNNAAYFGVGATEGQYIVIDMADGTLTANSNVEAVAGYAFNNKQSVFKCTTSGVAAFTVSKQAHIKNVYVYSPATLTVASNFATYANHNYAVDLTGVTGLTAFTADLNGDKDAIVFTPITKIPAGTGVLLMGETKSVPAITGANAVATNLLYAPTTAITDNSLVFDDGTYENYILSQPSGKNVGFYKANGNNVAVGKAYLRIEKSADARQFSFIGFDGTSESNGISAVESTSKAADGFYNLNGQRVSQPKSGLYIINGKKVIVK